MDESSIGDPWAVLFRLFYHADDRCVRRYVRRTGKQRGHHCAGCVVCILSADWSIGIQALWERKLIIGNSPLRTRALKVSQWVAQNKWARQTAAACLALNFFRLHLEDSLIFCDFAVAQLHATFGRYTLYV